MLLIFIAGWKPTSRILWSVFHHGGRSSPQSGKFQSASISLLFDAFHVLRSAVICISCSKRTRGKAKYSLNLLPIPYHLSFLIFCPAPHSSAPTLNLCFLLFSLCGVPRSLPDSPWTILSGCPFPLSAQSNKSFLPLLDLLSLTRIWLHWKLMIFTCFMPCWPKWSN